jgi:hypothetical protein
MAQSVRIWQKKQLRLDTLTFKQRDMVTIGSTGLLSVFKRVSAAQGPNDGPAKPLSPYYARYKSRMRKGNRRSLWFTGQMLGSLKLRTVSENRAYSAVGETIRTEKRLIKTTDKKWTRKGKFERFLTNKDVARANQKREPWLTFSPINRQAVIAKAREVLISIKNQLVHGGGI